MSRQGSKVVFVGNIPYDMTEEQIIDIMKEVGPVLSFKLMFDKETSRSRGYGFCEYSDPDTAASAIRNLNGHVLGDRQLRVDKADSEVPTYGTQTRATTLPTAPAVNTQISVPPIDAINQIISTMTNEQLTELLAQIKNMAISSPEQTRQLLAANPPLSYALLQALISMNLVDPATVQRIVQAMPAPPPIQPNAPATVAAPDQRQLIQQLMSLSMEQINALPPQQRDQILQLRAQLGR